MLPFEFTVEGPPLSHQTEDRKKLGAWKRRVREAAASHWTGEPPLAGDLRIVVTYYHEGEAIRMDNDNLIKPIQDALNGFIYNDDSQITDTSIRKTPMDTPVYVRGVSMILLEAFSRGKEFLHVRVEAAPDHAFIHG
jgi:Holliday junction resolvase RusA-like endonuclease